MLLRVLVRVTALVGAVGMWSCASGAPAPVGAQSGGLTPDGGVVIGGVGGGSGTGSGGMGGSGGSGSGALCEDATCAGTCCNMICVNTQADEGNCGMCGIKCPAGTDCLMGVCKCPSEGQTPCNGRCGPVRIR
jgi:hypothetical protein